MELWYWHHSYLTTDAALAQSKSIVEQAAQAGYTGMVLWDSSLIFMSRLDWPEKNVGYLRELVRYARSRGLTVMPLVAPYGHSDDVLRTHPEWTEGQRVIGGVSDAPVVPLGNERFGVEPWRQYRLHFLDGGSGPVGAIDGRSVRLDDVAHADVQEFVFNSAASHRVKVFGPGRFTLEQVHALPMDHYAAMTIYGEGVGMCLTKPAVRAWVANNARQVAETVGDGPLFMQYDEMRHMNSCPDCRAKGMTPGQLLAANVRDTIASLPHRRLYVWSDMFDPWHNAVAHLAYVEGSVAGSWLGLPRDMTVMNWNSGHRRASLEWFAALGNRQIIAGYYDPADHDGGAAARTELSAADGVPGIVGMMYTTWRDDYSQLASYAQAARHQWAEYQAAQPW